MIGNVSLDRQVRMQNVSGVGCDTAEELIIRGAELVGDGRQIIVAVVKPLAATALTDRILCYGKRLHMTKGAETLLHAMPVIMTKSGGNVKNKPVDTYTMYRHLRISPLVITELSVKANIQY